LVIDSRDWSNLVGNPDALAEKEKALWLEVEPILRELLDELKSHDKIENVFVKAELDDLETVLRTQQNCALNYNRLIHATTGQKGFVELLEPFGFDDRSTADMFIQTGILLTVLTTELFRTILLFHSKGLNPEGTLRSMLNELAGANFAPNSIRKLRKYVEIEFRNALAHGLVGTKEKKIVLYKNSKFEILEIMDLADFMIRSKTQSVLTHCLINVIVERKREGVFQ
jgi:hypothetical protein